MEDNRGVARRTTPFPNQLQGHGAVMNANLRKVLIMVYSLVGGAFHLYTGAFGAMAPPTQRGIHVFFLIPLCFLFVPSRVEYLRNNPRADNAFNIVLLALSFLCFGWYTLNWERLYANPSLTPLDLVAGIVSIVLVLESVRRTVGRFIAGLMIFFLVYAVIGPYIPHRFLAHQGYGVSSIVYLIFYGTEGIYGTPIAVCATFIVLIVMLGGFLNVTGGADFFMNISKSVAGTARGGPAKIAVFSSGLFGMISGSTVANVATTGSVTIPMMKRLGFSPIVAGAVESLASSGGQLMPPIMGAAAFIMVEYLMIPYIKLCLYALIPAVLYFFSVFMVVHFHSCRVGMAGIPRSECPRFFKELAHGGHMLIPIVILVILLAKWIGPMLAVFYAITSLWIVSSIRRHTRMTIRSFVEGVLQGMQAMAPLTAICAGAGIIIGVLSMTGLGMRMAFIIELLSHGHLLIALILTMVACIILGMGLPTVAAYVVLAVIVPPTLTNMGIGRIEAHMFIFYFAILSAITPPVATGAYTAAGIAQCDPMATGFCAMRLGLVAFLLPYAFVYRPGLLLHGIPWEIVRAVIFTSIGILAWAAATGKYLFREISFPVQIILGLSGIMLIIPEYWTSIMGLGITLFIIIYHYLQHRRLSSLEAQKVVA
ncbi:MAG: TRAP transporter permease [Deltaproteobacteria bacterium]|nr:TRAP transporter permease [Deltaproteobacteria bacterium]